MATACPTPPRAVDAGVAVPVLDVVPALTSVDAGAPATLAAARDDAALWEELRRRSGVATVDALRSCTSSDQCVTLVHFTRCCDFLSLNATHKRVLESARRAITGAHQTRDELRMCQVASCSGVLPPSTCAAGRCVVDPERPMWIEVARAAGVADVDTLRACTASSDCVLIAHPTRCCGTASVAKLLERKARGVNLWPPEEAARCAGKACGIFGEPVCVEGLCRVGARERE